MKKLALGMFMVLAAACGSKGNETTIVVPPDVSVDAITQCDPLAQTGCASGEKCTWIHDDDGNTSNPENIITPLGHIGCTAAGAAATGAA
jgi:hypothetical protein